MFSVPIQSQCEGIFPFDGVATSGQVIAERRHLGCEVLFQWDMEWSCYQCSDKDLMELHYVQHRITYINIWGVAANAEEFEKDNGISIIGHFRDCFLL